MSQPPILEPFLAGEHPSANWLRWLLRLTPAKPRPTKPT